MNCLKGHCPFNAEYVCVLAEFVKCVQVLVRICLYVCVQYVLSLHLTSFVSDVGGRQKHTELIRSELETF